MDSLSGHLRPSAERVFDLLKIFNRLVVLDEALARRLPDDEFELDFDEAGDIYVNGQALGVNVPRRLADLSGRGA